MEARALKILLKWSHTPKRLKGFKSIISRVPRVLGSEDTTRFITTKHRDVFLEQEKGHMIT